MSVRKANACSVISNPTATAMNSENAEQLPEECSAIGLSVIFGLNRDPSRRLGSGAGGSGRAPDQLDEAARDIPLNAGGHMLVARSHGRPSPGGRRFTLGCLAPRYSRSAMIS